jgi:hypothetical protein
MSERFCDICCKDVPEEMNLNAIKAIGAGIQYVCQNCTDEAVKINVPLAELKPGTFSDATPKIHLSEAVHWRTGTLGYDKVQRPEHYNVHPSGIECIEITRHMSFNAGNAVKYIWRAGLKSKDILTDLKKALWYIQDEITRIENHENRDEIYTASTNAGYNDFIKRSRDIQEASRNSQEADDSESL